ncbi:MAG: hypothetical protein ACI9GM_001127 [Salibacteraceae bacterium]|jgi:uncharacterized protein (DUF2147 family)
MKKIWSLAVIMMISAFSFAQSADDIIGTWYTEGGKSKVEITKKGDKYSGKIIWLKEPNRADGTAKLDKSNEEETLRSRGILGLPVIQNFQWDDDEYEDGTIYDPENGKTYSCEITWKDINTLNVRGYIGFSLLGRDTVWSRLK